ncbi:MAG: substrate-binding periplasmic protein [Bdellovibrionales bacterium]
MKKFLTVVALVIIAAGAGWYGAGLRYSEGSTTSETAFERVMRTKTLRCAYALWPPSILMKDPNTGKISGAAADIIELLAQRTGLKVEWTEEVGWSSYIEGLDTGRYDAFCSMGWLMTERTARVRYSLPITYSSLHMYARTDDQRFNDGLSGLNDPAYGIAVMDGEISQKYATKHFPKARQVATPQVGDITQIFLDVATNKADVVFNDPSLAREFNEKNPGKLRQVTKEPLAVYANVFAVGFKENDLQEFINASLQELFNFGDIDRIFAKYEPDRSVFMPIAKPYVLPAAPQ